MAGERRFVLVDQLLTSDRDSLSYSGFDIYELSYQGGDAAVNSYGRVITVQNSGGLSGYNAVLSNYAFAATGDSNQITISGNYSGYEDELLHLVRYHSAGSNWYSEADVSDTIISLDTNYNAYFYAFNAWDGGGESDPVGAVRFVGNNKLVLTAQAGAELTKYNWTGLTERTGWKTDDNIKLRSDNFSFFTPWKFDNTETNGTFTNDGAEETNREDDAHLVYGQGGEITPTTQTLNYTIHSTGDTLTVVSDLVGQIETNIGAIHTGYVSKGDKENVSQNNSSNINVEGAAVKVDGTLILKGNQRAVIEVSNNNETFDASSDNTNTGHKVYLYDWVYVKPQQGEPYYKIASEPDDNGENFAVNCFDISDYGTVIAGFASPTANDNVVSNYGVHAGEIELTSGVWSGQITVDTSDVAIIANSSWTRAESENGVTASACNNEISAYGIYADNITIAKLGSLSEDYDGVNQAQKYADDDYNIKTSVSNTYINVATAGKLEQDKFTPGHINATGNQIISAAIYSTGNVNIGEISEDFKMFAELDDNELVLNLDVDSSTNHNTYAYSLGYVGVGISANNINIGKFNGSITVSTDGFDRDTALEGVKAGESSAGTMVFGLRAQSLTGSHNFGGEIILQNTATLGELVIWNDDGTYSLNPSRGALGSGIDVASITINGVIDTDIKATRGQFGIYAGTLIADGFTGSISASEMDESVELVAAVMDISKTPSVGLDIRNNLSSGVTGDAFDMAGSITADDYGITTLGALNVRVSGNITAATAIKGERYVDYTTGIVGAKHDDIVSIARTAIINGDIELGLLLNTVTINSNARVNGVIRTLGGSLNLNFELDGPAATTPTYTISAYDEEDALLKDSNTLAVNLSYAQAGAYTLVRYGYQECRGDKGGVVSDYINGQDTIKFDYLGKQLELKIGENGVIDGITVSSEFIEHNGGYELQVTIGGNITAPAQLNLSADGSDYVTVTKNANGVITGLDWSELHEYLENHVNNDLSSVYDYGIEMLNAYELTYRFVDENGDDISEEDIVVTFDQLQNGSITGATPIYIAESNIPVGVRFSEVPDNAVDVVWSLTPKQDSVEDLSLISAIRDQMLTDRDDVTGNLVLDWTDLHGDIADNDDIKSGATFSHYEVTYTLYAGDGSVVRSGSIFFENDPNGTTEYEISDSADYRVEWSLKLHTITDAVDSANNSLVVSSTDDAGNFKNYLYSNYDAEAGQLTLDLTELRRELAEGDHEEYGFANSFANKYEIEYILVDSNGNALNYSNTEGKIINNGTLNTNVLNSTATIVSYVSGNYEDSNGKTTYTFDGVAEGMSVVWRMRVVGNTSGTLVSQWSAWQTVKASANEVAPFDFTGFYTDVRDIRNADAGFAVGQAVAELSWDGIKSSEAVRCYEVQYIIQANQVTLSEAQAAGFNSVEEYVVSDDFFRRNNVTAYSKVVSGNAVTLSNLKSSGYCYWRIRALDETANLSAALSQVETFVDNTVGNELTTAWNTEENPAAGISPNPGVSEWFMGDTFRVQTSDDTGAPVFTTGAVGSFVDSIRPEAFAGNTDLTGYLAWKAASDNSESGVNRYEVEIFSDGLDIEALPEVLRFSEKGVGRNIGIWGTALTGDGYTVRIGTLNENGVFVADQREVSVDDITSMEDIILMSAVSDGRLYFSASGELKLADKYVQIMNGSTVVATVNAEEFACYSYDYQEVLHADNIFPASILRYTTTNDQAEAFDLNDEFCVGTVNDQGGVDQAANYKVAVRRENGQTVIHVIYINGNGADGFAAGLSIYSRSFNNSTKEYDDWDAEAVITFEANFLTNAYYTDYDYYVDFSNMDLFVDPEQNYNYNITAKDFNDNQATNSGSVLFDNAEGNFIEENPAANIGFYVDTTTPRAVGAPSFLTGYIGWHGAEDAQSGIRKYVVSLVDSFGRTITDMNGVSCTDYVDVTLDKTTPGITDRSIVSWTHADLQVDQDYIVTYEDANGNTITLDAVCKNVDGVATLIIAGRGNLNDENLTISGGVFQNTAVTVGAQDSNTTCEYYEFSIDISQWQLPSTPGSITDTYNVKLEAVDYHNNVTTLQPDGNTQELEIVVDHDNPVFTAVADEPNSGYVVDVQMPDSLESAPPVSGEIAWKKAIDNDSEIAYYTVAVMDADGNTVRTVYVDRTSTDYSSQSQSVVTWYSEDLIYDTADPVTYSVTVNGTTIGNVAVRCDDYGRKYLDATGFDSSIDMESAQVSVSGRLVRNGIEVVCGRDETTQQYFVEYTSADIVAGEMYTINFADGNVSGQATQDGVLRITTNRLWNSEQVESIAGSFNVAGLEESDDYSFKYYEITSATYIVELRGNFVVGERYAVGNISGILAKQDASGAYLRFTVDNYTEGTTYVVEGINDITQTVAAYDYSLEFTADWGLIDENYTYQVTATDRFGKSTVIAEESLGLTVDQGDGPNIDLDVEGDVIDSFVDYSNPTLTGDAQPDAAQTTISGYIVWDKAQDRDVPVSHYTVTLYRTDENGNKLYEGEGENRAPVVVGSKVIDFTQAPSQDNYQAPADHIAGNTLSGRTMIAWADESLEVDKVYTAGITRTFVSVDVSGDDISVGCSYTVVLSNGTNVVGTIINDTLCFSAEGNLDGVEFSVDLDDNELTGVINSDNARYTFDALEELEAVAKNVNGTTLFIIGEGNWIGRDLTIIDNDGNEYHLTEDAVFKYYDYSIDLDAVFGSDLTENNYIVEIQGFDSLGNGGRVDTHTVRIDNSAPSFDDQDNDEVVTDFVFATEALRLNDSETDPVTVAIRGIIAWDKATDDDSEILKYSINVYHKVYTEQTTPGEQGGTVTETIITDELVHNTVEIKPGADCDRSIAIFSSSELTAGYKYILSWNGNTYSAVAHVGSTADADPYVKFYSNIGEDWSNISGHSVYFENTAGGQTYVDIANGFTAKHYDYTIDLSDWELDEAEYSYQITATDLFGKTSNIAENNIPSLVEDGAGPSFTGPGGAYVEATVPASITAAAGLTGWVCWQRAADTHTDISKYVITLTDEDGVVVGTKTIDLTSERVEDSGDIIDGDNVSSRSIIRLTAEDLGLDAGTDLILDADAGKITKLETPYNVSYNDSAVKLEWSVKEINGTKYLVITADSDLRGKDLTISGGNIGDTGTSCRVTDNCEYYDYALDLDDFNVQAGGQYNVTIEAYDHFGHPAETEQSFELLTTDGSAPEFVNDGSDAVFKAQMPASMSDNPQHTGVIAWDRALDADSEIKSYTVNVYEMVATTDDKGNVTYTRSETAVKEIVVDLSQEKTVDGVNYQESACKSVARYEHKDLVVGETYTIVIDVNGDGAIQEGKEEYTVVAQGTAGKAYLEWYSKGSEDLSVAGLTATISYLNTKGKPEAFASNVEFGAVHYDYSVVIDGLKLDGSRYEYDIIAEDYFGEESKISGGEIVDDFQVPFYEATDRAGVYIDAKQPASLIANTVLTGYIGWNKAADSHTGIRNYIVTLTDEAGAFVGTKTIDLTSEREEDSGDIIDGDNVNSRSIIRLTAEDLGLDAATDLILDADAGKITKLETPYTVSIDGISNVECVVRSINGVNTLIITAASDLRGEELTISGGNIGDTGIACIVTDDNCEYFDYAIGIDQFGDLHGSRYNVVIEAEDYFGNKSATNTVLDFTTDNGAPNFGGQKTDYVVISNTPDTMDITTTPSLLTGNICWNRATDNDAEIRNYVVQVFDKDGNAVLDEEGNALTKVVDLSKTGSGAKPLSIATCNDTRLVAGEVYTITYHSGSDMYNAFGEKIVYEDGVLTEDSGKHTTGVAKVGSDGKVYIEWNFDADKVSDKSMLMINPVAANVENNVVGMLFFGASDTIRVQKFDYAISIDDWQLGQNEYTYQITAYDYFGNSTTIAESALGLYKDGKDQAPTLSNVMASEYITIDSKVYEDAIYTDPELTDPTITGFIGWEKAVDNESGILKYVVQLLDEDGNVMNGYTKTVDLSKNGPTVTDEEGVVTNVTTITDENGVVTVLDDSLAKMHSFSSFIAENLVVGDMYKVTITDNSSNKTWTKDVMAQQVVMSEGHELSSVIRDKEVKYLTWFDDISLNNNVEVVITDAAGNVVTGEFTSRHYDYTVDIADWNLTGQRYQYKITAYDYYGHEVTSTQYKLKADSYTGPYFDNADASSNEFEYNGNKNTSSDKVYDVTQKTNSATTADGITTVKFVRGDLDTATYLDGNITWSKAADQEIGIRYYEMLLSGGEYKVTATSETTGTGNDQKTTYTNKIIISDYDADRNYSLVLGGKVLNSDEYTFSVDEKGTATYTLKDTSKSYSNQSVEFNEVLYLDADGVDGVLTFDGNTYTLDLGELDHKLTNYSYTYKIYAVDMFGNRSEMLEAVDANDNKLGYTGKFSVDNEAPVFDNGSVTEALSYTFDAANNTYTAVLGWNNASDDIGIHAYRIVLTDKAGKTIEERVLREDTTKDTNHDSFAIWSSEKLVAGEIYTVVFADGSDKQVKATESKATVDFNKEDGTLQNGIREQEIVGVRSISWSGIGITGGPVTIKYGDTVIAEIKGTPDKTHTGTEYQYANYTDSFGITGLAQGEYSYAIYAEDYFGKESATPVTGTLVYDNIAPEFIGTTNKVSWIAGKDGKTIVPTFTWSAAEDGSGGVGMYQYKIFYRVAGSDDTFKELAEIEYAAGNKEYTYTHSLLDAESYEYEIRAYDKVGNVSKLSGNFGSSDLQNLNGDFSGQSAEVEIIKGLDNQNTAKVTLTWNYSEAGDAKYYRVLVNIGSKTYEFWTTAAEVTANGGKMVFDNTMPGRPVDIFADQTSFKWVVDAADENYNIALTASKDWQTCDITERIVATSTPKPYNVKLIRGAQVNGVNTDTIGVSWVSGSEKLGVYYYEITLQRVDENGEAMTLDVDEYGRPYKYTGSTLFVTDKDFLAADMDPKAVTVKTSGNYSTLTIADLCKFFGVTSFPEGDYKVTVTAYGAQGADGVASDTVGVTIDTVRPGSVSVITAKAIAVNMSETVQQHELVIEWNEVKDASGIDYYIVEYRAAGSSAWAKQTVDNIVGETQVFSTRVNDLQNASSIEYRITAVDKSGNTGLPWSSFKTIDIVSDGFRDTLNTAADKTSEFETAGGSYAIKGEAVGRGDMADTFKIVTTVAQTIKLEASGFDQVTGTNRYITVNVYEGKDYILVGSLVYGENGLVSGSDEYSLKAGTTYVFEVVNNDPDKASASRYDLTLNRISDSEVDETWFNIENFTASVSDTNNDSVAGVITDSATFKWGGLIGGVGTADKTGSEPKYYQIEYIVLSEQLTTEQLGDLSIEEYVLSNEFASYNTTTINVTGNSAAYKFPSYGYVYWRIRGSFDDPDTAAVEGATSNWVAGSQFYYGEAADTVKPDMSKLSHSILGVVFNKPVDNDADGVNTAESTTLKGKIMWNDGAFDVNSGIKEYLIQISTNGGKSYNQWKTVGAEAVVTAQSQASYTYYALDSSKSYTIEIDGVIYNGTVKVNDSSKILVWDSAVDASGNASSGNWMGKTAVICENGTRLATITLGDDNCIVYQYAAEFDDWSNGSYNYRIAAVDYSGNVSDWIYGKEFVADKGAPVFMDENVNVVVGNSPDKTTINATLTWKPATDYTGDLGIRYYEVQVKAAGDSNWTTMKVIGSADNQSSYEAVVSGLKPGDYEFQIVANDYFGNKAVIGGSFGMPDDVPPVGNFTAFTSSVKANYITKTGTRTVKDENTGKETVETYTYQVLEDASVTLDWSDTFTDAAHYKVIISDNANFAKTDGSKYYEFWTTSSEAESTKMVFDNTSTGRPVGVFEGITQVYVRVIAYDASYNPAAASSGTNSFYFTDNSKADGNPITLSSDTWIAQPENIKVNVSYVDGCHNDQVTVSWTTDNTLLGIYTYKVELLNANWQTVAAQTTLDLSDRLTNDVKPSNAFSIESGSSSTTVTIHDLKKFFGMTELTDGSYTVRITAYDALGNKVDPATESWSWGSRSHEAYSSQFVIDTHRPGMVEITDYLMIPSSVGENNHTNALMIRWKPIDDASGIDHYEIYYRVKGETDWHKPLIVPSYITSTWDLPKEQWIDFNIDLNNSDKECEFYVQAIDKQGNIGDCPPDNYKSVKLVSDKYTNNLSNAPELEFEKDRGVVSDLIGLGDTFDCFKITTPAADVASGVALKLVVDELYAVSGYNKAIRIDIYEGDNKQWPWASYWVGESGRVFNDLLLKAGTEYTFAVSNTDGSQISASQYKLVIDKTALPVSLDDDNWRNTDQEFALPGTDNAVSSFHDWVGSGDTVDYRKLEVSASGKYTFTLNDVANDVVMTVYQVARDWQNNDYLQYVGSVYSGSWNVNGASINSLLLDNGNTYYLEVKAANIYAYGTDYTVNVKCEDAFPLPSTDDNTTGNLTVLQKGKEVKDWVGFNDEFDYYKITVDSADAYSINLENTNGTEIRVSLGYVDQWGNFCILQSAYGAYGSNALNLAYQFQNWVLDIEKSGAKNEFFIQVAANGYQANSEYTLSYTNNSENPLCSNADDRILNYWEAQYTQDSYEYKKLAPGSTVNEWVGMGDTSDFIQLDSNSGIYDITIENVESPMYVTLYQAVRDAENRISYYAWLNGAYIDGASKTAVFDNMLLDANGEYYVGVTSYGQNSNYTVSVNNPAGTVEAARDITEPGSKDNVTITLNPEKHWTGTPVYYVYDASENGGAYKFALKADKDFTGYATLTVYELLDNGSKRWVSGYSVASGSSADTGYIYMADKAVSNGTGIYMVEIKGAWDQCSGNVEYTVSGYEFPTSDTDGVIKVGASKDGWVGMVGAEDKWDKSDKYTFNTAKAGVYTIDLSNYDGNKITVSILDENGYVVKSYYPAYNSSATSFAYNFEAGKDYTIEVAANWGSFSEYTLEVTEVKDEDNSYDTLGEARSGKKDVDAADGWVGLNDGNDYYKLKVDETGCYELNVSNISKDLNLTVYEISDSIYGGYNITTKYAYVQATDNSGVMSLYLDANKEYYVQIGATNAWGWGDTSYSWSLSGMNKINALNCTNSDAVGCGNKADYYQFTAVDGASNFTLELTDELQNTNFTLYKVNSDGSWSWTAAMSAGAWNTKAQTGALCLEAGATYVVEVAAPWIPQGSTVDYTLTVDGWMFDRNKDADTMPEATELNLSGGKATVEDQMVWNVNGNPANADYADYYKLVVSESGSYTIDLADINGNTINVSIGRDYDGWYGASYGATGGYGADSLSMSFNLDKGTYYIKVESVGWNTASQYDLTLTHNNALKGFNNEDDSWQKVAGNIDSLTFDANDTISDWVGFGDSVDVFKIRLGDIDADVNSNSRVKIVTSDDETKAALDNWELGLSLVDANGWYVGLNYVGDGVFETDRVLSADTDYYLSVNNYASWQKNIDYKFDIELA